MLRSNSNFEVNCILFGHLASCRHVNFVHYIRIVLQTLSEVMCATDNGTTTAINKKYFKMCHDLKMTVVAYRYV